MRSSREMGRQSGFHGQFTSETRSSSSTTSESDSLWHSQTSPIQDSLSHTAARNSTTLKFVITKSISASLSSSTSKFKMSLGEGHPTIGIIMQCISQMPRTAGEAAQTASSNAIICGSDFCCFRPKAWMPQLRQIP